MRAFVVDTFTQTMFRRSPAGGVLLDQPADSGWMQAVAAEFNHPATAFLEPFGDRAAATGLRWFSPITELSLCGHATLASAHILGGDQIFQTCSGVLACSVAANRATPTTNRSRSKINSSRHNVHRWIGAKTRVQVSRTSSRVPTI